ncbi:MAG: PLP-dependent aspartate aminotransferase family protein [Propionibacteriaceae bacterium]|nr:PLP-dependent aspartate aminotransferase family protein [Propionibacteriaceae bacterium]
MSDTSQGPSRFTRAVRAGAATETYRDLVPPIHLTSTYAFTELGQTPQFDYSRSHNPTREVFAHAVAALEGGYDAVVTASGMGALTACVEAMAPERGLVVAPRDCYGGTYRLLSAYAAKGRFDVRFADLTNLDEAAKAVVGAGLVFVESPSNPLLRLTDIAAVTTLAHAAGAQVVADNTFATPVYCRPFELGVDAVVHSATKYLAGHSDVILGVAVSGTPELQAKLYDWCNTLGLTAGAFDAYLGLRGVRTFKLRVEQASANAAALAESLRGHRLVEEVFYPGFGAMVSFRLPSFEAARVFTSALHQINLAESLGGVESIIAHPVTMSHADVPEAARLAAGITDGTLRLSVGVEDVDDLWSDIRQALDAIPS